MARLVAAQRIILRICMSRFEERLAAGRYPFAPFASLHEAEWQNVLYMESHMG
jgi:hypothetical protein